MTAKDFDGTWRNTYLKQTTYGENNKIMSTIECDIGKQKCAVKDAIRIIRNGHVDEYTVEDTCVIHDVGVVRIDNDTFDVVLNQHLEKSDTAGITTNSYQLKIAGDTLAFHNEQSYGEANKQWKNGVRRIDTRSVFVKIHGTFPDPNWPKRACTSRN
jgi:hypothetical protein